MVEMSKSDWDATCSIYNLFDDLAKEEEHPASSCSASPLVLVKADQEPTSSVHKDENEVDKTDFVLQGSVDLPIQVRDTVLIRGILSSCKYTDHDSKFDPCFLYKEMLEEYDTPTITVQFQYRYTSSTDNSDNNNDEYYNEDDYYDEGPISVKVTRLSFPEKKSMWCSGLVSSLAKSGNDNNLQQQWMDWLTEECMKLLKEHENSSYDICQYLQYESFNFFNAVHKQEDFGITLVLAMDNDQNNINEEGPNLETQESNNNQKYTENDRTPNASKSTSSSSSTADTGSSWISFFPKRLRRKKRVGQGKSMGKSNKMTFNQPYSVSTTSCNSITKIDTIVQEFIISSWKQYCEIQCPICFDDIPLLEAKEIIPCRHYYCYDCITRYAKMITAEELKIYQQTNPYQCPVVSCRTDIKINTCIKTLLTKEEMAQVRLWYKDIKNPKSKMLTTCPRTATRSSKNGGASKAPLCTATNSMRKVQLDSNVVYCDKCNFQWCELCLARIPLNCTFTPNNHECDPYNVIILCQKYKTSSPKTQQLYQERYPWISDYCANRLDDLVTLEWAKENASMCPTCKTYIERSDGCFHMRCVQCNTHFCYECGEEIFPPYYGTHHCWEKDQMQQEQLEEMEQLAYLQLF